MAGVKGQAGKQVTGQLTVTQAASGVLFLLKPGSKFISIPNAGNHSFHHTLPFYHFIKGHSGTEYRWVQGTRPGQLSQQREGVREASPQVTGKTHLAVSIVQSVQEARSQTRGPNRCQPTAGAAKTGQH